MTDSVAKLPIPSCEEELRQAFIRFVGSLAERRHNPFDLHVTLIPKSRSPWRWANPMQLERFGLPRYHVPLNRDRLSHVARHLLRDWDARVSRALCGSHFTKKPDERPVGIAMLEFETDQGEIPHWHCHMNVLPEHRDRFPEEAAKAWTAIAPGGSCYVQPIGMGSERVAGYDLKEPGILHQLDRVVFLNGRLPL